MSMIAIDFGTSRTKLAYLPPDGSRPELLRFGGDQDRPYTPSMFYLAGGTEDICFGDAAEEMMEDDATGIVATPVKRQLRSAKVRTSKRAEPPGRLLEVMLDQLRTKAARELAALAGQAPSAVTLTVPAGRWERERALLEQSARAVGFTEVTLVEEPVAAATAWLAETGQPVESVVVLDCGGGTVDWAWLRRQDGRLRLADSPPSGSVRHGGHDVDMGLLELLEQAPELADADPGELVHHRGRVLSRLRRLKEGVARGRDPWPIRVAGRSIRLSREAILEVATARFVSLAADELRGYLERVKAETPGGDLPPVLMVGGSARLPGLADAAKELGCDVLGWDRADFAPVLGALMVGRSTTAPSPAPKATARREVSPTVRKAIEEALGKDDLAGLQTATAALFDGQTEIPQSYEEAAVYFRRAAEQKDAVAQDISGDFHYYGRGVQQSYEEAARLYKLAADQGNANAQCNLGYLYEYGNGVQQSYVEAGRFYKLAADQGYSHAQLRLGILYAHGNGVQQSYAEAARLYKLAADQGYSHAQLRLGILYAHGNGVQQSYAEAARLYKLATNQGDAFAQVCLGGLYEDGNGVQQSHVEAARLYKLAADQGNAFAQTKLGYLYGTGQGVQQSHVEAARLYKLAADQGYARAQFRLGVLYATGNGVQQSHVEAARLYKLAADQGNAFAQCNLGVLYEDGKGVPQSYAEAARLYKLAADQGNERAKRSVSRLRR